MIYIFKLPVAVTGQTHVSVESEHLVGGSVRVEGVYGKLSRGTFTKAEQMSLYTRALNLEEWLDFQAQVTSRGRPEGAPENDFRRADVADWLENEPAALVRIEAKRVAEAGDL